MMRECLRSNRGVLIAGIAILMLGLGLDVVWFLRDPRVAPLHVINVLPGLLLLTVWYLASAFPRRRWLLLGLGLLVTLLGVGFTILVNLGAAAWEAATTSVDDVARYEAVLGDLGHPNERLVAHFPVHIPENATQVMFYYLPAFLQGGANLQLRCKLPSSEVDSVLQRYLATAQQVQNSRGDVIEAKGDYHPLPTPSFRNEDDSGFAPLPEGFLVLVLDAKPYRTDPVDWNHGYSYGVAVSTERQEVIYWAEYW